MLLLTRCLLGTESIRILAFDTKPISCIKIAVQIICHRHFHLVKSNMIPTQLKFESLQNDFSTTSEFAFCYKGGRPPNDSRPKKCGSLQIFQKRKNNRNNSRLFENNGLLSLPLKFFLAESQTKNMKYQPVSAQIPVLPLQPSNSLLIFPQT